MCFVFYSREEEKVEEIKTEKRIRGGNFADLKDEDERGKTEKCQGKYGSKTDKERGKPNKLKRRQRR